MSGKITSIVVLKAGAIGVKEQMRSVLRKGLVVALPAEVSRSLCVAIHFVKLSSARLGATRAFAEVLSEH